MDFSSANERHEKPYYGEQYCSLYDGGRNDFHPLLWRRSRAASSFRRVALNVLATSSWDNNCLADWMTDYKHMSVSVESFMFSGSPDNCGNNFLAEIRVLAYIIQKV